ncbi:hypothetical protein GCM10023195_23530 [Actinoallomurus liliacearum]|uniref:Uncharacterized protein n=1 Tax=Actinoallomurus liliacearum TaxID=1080073 RepID=A0ABP8TI69_9ACTN
MKEKPVVRRLRPRSTAEGLGAPAGCARTRLRRAVTDALTVTEGGRRRSAFGPKAETDAPRAR